MTAVMYDDCVRIFASLSLSLLLASVDSPFYPSSSVRNESHSRLPPEQYTQKPGSVCVLVKEGEEEEKLS